MTALGVEGDTPPTSSQPPLADGIHLRWGFERTLGFPWHGFYLFRRPAQDSALRCLGPSLNLLSTMAPRTAWSSPLGIVSSDQPLVTAGDPASHLELDLRKRKSIRLDLPPNEPARRVQVSIRAAGAAAKKTCAAFTTPEKLPNPFTRDGLRFTVTTAPKQNAAQATVTTARGLTGLECDFETSIELPAPSDRVTVSIFHADVLPTLRAFDAAGKLLIEKPGNPDWWTIYTIELAAKNIARIAIEGRTFAYLSEICYETVDPKAKKTQVRVRALDGKTEVGEAMIQGTASAELHADRITAVDVEGGADARLVDICVAFVSDDATTGWKPLAGVNPITLPIESSAGYPAAGAPSTAAAAEALAIGRITYGNASAWSGQRYADVHAQLAALVANGPNGGAMAGRSVVVASAPDPAPPAPPSVKMPRQRPLDLLLIGALHPAVAQMLGLYHVDKSAQPNVGFDYLVVADPDGSFQGKEQLALAQITLQGFTSIDGWIVFDRKRAPATPLAPPENVRAYALPAAARHDQQAAQNGTGLRWTTPARSPIVMVHVWRRSYGANQPNAPAAASAFSLLTNDQPVLVTQSPSITPDAPRMPSDWPPMPLYMIDAGLGDGWYGYCASGVDVFGRHSALSGSATWWQWSPMPDPRPWYYQGNGGDQAVHPFAIRLLDKLAPPPPTAIEAAVLDPDDPFLVQDAAYLAWRSTVSATLIGLRVRWRWPQSHALQAPDANEFRVYFNAGSKPPAGSEIATNWSSRIFVKPVAQHTRTVTEADGTTTRVYEIFLPAPLASLTPALATPLLYAQVSVSTADDKQHTNDAPKWTGPLGNRRGNEGAVGTPATVYRVLRTPPSPPDPVTDAERVLASAADYQNRSFYSYRWRPSPFLKVHVYRALDESVFLADWKKRPRPPLSLTDSAFPNTPRWNQATRQQVATALDALNAFTDAANAMAYYRALPDDALRVLASQADIADAFTQITLQPLDPAASETTNLRGPDNPDSFPIDTTLRVYIDNVNGRGRNRYFYRAAYVDGAQNRSVLSVADPPVYLPVVDPPRAPVITKIAGGDRQITLTWAANRESNLAGYRVYRTTSKDDTRDVRLMTSVSVAPPTGAPASVTHIDQPIPARTTFYYCVVAVDSDHNVSAPSAILAARAVDHSIPPPPTWLRSEWIAIDPNGTEHPLPSGALPPGWRKTVALSWSMSENALTSLERRALGQSSWMSLSGWLTTTERDATNDVWIGRWIDATADATVVNIYRLKIESISGNLNIAFDERSVDPQ